MREIEMFMIRQQQMVDAHRVQMEIPKPKHVIVPDHAQELENDRRIAELRRHITELRGELPRVIEVAKSMQREIRTHGTIFNRHDI